MNLYEIIRVIGTVISICVAIFGVIAFCIIKFNDLAHIDKKLEKLDTKTDEQGKEIGKLSSQISNIDGYIKGNKSNI